MDTKRYFTVQEANALIPMLEERFGRILRLRSQLRTAYQELERLGETPSAETLTRLSGPPELRAARGKFRALMEALQEDIRAVEATGAEIKDLDIGLCDFLGRRRGRDVYLCWRYGERQITHWHDLNAGFAGRQPLDEGELPPRVVH
ncbi:MAG: DUF2203 domain-containing protein [Myxococcales bacterium]|nr:DUF2203 domain-containing protein [Myxococcota bacterium]MDW8282086.1 DUF2203 domain-containing protein [Myxococcales bacterium]